MKNLSEIRHALRRLEQRLPYLAAELDPGRLSTALHRSYELLMIDTPHEMQDEVHDAIRTLMVRAGVSRRNLR